MKLYLKPCCKKLKDYKRKESQIRVRISSPDITVFERSVAFVLNSSSMYLCKLQVNVCVLSGRHEEEEEREWVREEDRKVPLALIRCRSERERKTERFSQSVENGPKIK